MQSKEEARGLFRELRRKSQSPDRQAPGRILLTSPEIRKAQVIASFQSYGEEPDTFALHEYLEGQGKTIYLPRLNPDKSLTWLHRGIEVNVEDLNRVEVVVLPALAIDSRGVRLGQGGGSFDRSLPQLKGWKVALIDSVCLSPINLPEEEHDVRVDAVVSENGIVRFS